MLVRRGVFLHAALRRTRVTESEVRAAVRAAGVSDLETVEAVVLEADGSFSVLPHGSATTGSSLSDVRAPAIGDTSHAA